MLWASQVAPGNENGLTLRVYGAKGGIEWRAGAPEPALVTPFGEPTRICHARRGTGERGRRARDAHSGGPPEGYLEAFATIYAEVGDRDRGPPRRSIARRRRVFPGIDDGVAGVAFIEAAIRSSRGGGVWVALDTG